MKLKLHLDFLDDIDGHRGTQRSKLPSLIYDQYIIQIAIVNLLPCMARNQSIRLKVLL